MINESQLENSSVVGSEAGTTEHVKRRRFRR
jgi:hypothetical protein